MDGASGTPCEGGHHSSLGLPSWAMCVGRGAERGVGEEILRKSDCWMYKSAVFLYYV